MHKQPRKNQKVIEERWVKSPQIFIFGPQIMVLKISRYGQHQFLSWQICGTIETHMFHGYQQIHMHIAVMADGPIGNTYGRYDQCQSFISPGNDHLRL